MITSTDISETAIARAARVDVAPLTTARKREQTEARNLARARHHLNTLPQLTPGDGRQAVEALAVARAEENRRAEAHDAAIADVAREAQATAAALRDATAPALTVAAEQIAASIADLDSALAALQSVNQLHAAKSLSRPTSPHTIKLLQRTLVELRVVAGALPGGAHG